MQGTKIHNYPIEKLPTTNKFSMPTLNEEIKPVVLVKYELEYRQKIKLRCFPWNFRTIRTVMQERKTMIF